MNRPAFKAKTIQELRDGFWRRVEIADRDECWKWTGRHSRAGYGQVTTAVKLCGELIATRVAWFLTKGTQPPRNLQVCHKCDNPPCVNPSHLFLGTAKDNAQDAIRKGRFKIPIHGRFIGEDERIKIFDQFVHQKLTRKELANKFNVSTAAVKLICHQKRIELGQKPTWNLADRLSESDRRTIIKMFSSGVPRIQIAKKFGISLNSIYNVIAK